MVGPSGTGKTGGWWGRQLALAKAQAKVKAILEAPDGYERITRVAPTPKLTPTQLAIVKLLCAGHSHQEIADTFGCTVRTVKAHVEDAAVRIPGEDYPSARLIHWYRGASASVLGGISV